MKRVGETLTCVRTILTYVENYHHCIPCNIQAYEGTYESKPPHQIVIGLASGDKSGQLINYLSMEQGDRELALLEVYNGHCILRCPTAEGASPAPFFLGVLMHLITLIPVLLLPSLLAMPSPKLGQALRAPTNAERLARGLPPARPKRLYEPKLLQGTCVYYRTIP